MAFRCEVVIRVPKNPFVVEVISTRADDTGVLPPTAIDPPKLELPATTRNAQGFVITLVPPGVGAAKTLSVDRFVYVTFDERGASTPPSKLDKEPFATVPLLAVVLFTTFALLTLKK